MRWYWIDRFIEFERGKRAKAIKNVSLAEEHLHDHFPGYPVMPPSLIIEGLAQTGGLLVAEYNQFKEKVVLAKIPKATFYDYPTPGDTLTYCVEVEYIRKDGAMIAGQCRAGDRLIAEMEIVFAHLDNAFSRRTLFEPGELVRMMRILKAYDIGRDENGNPLQEPKEA